MAVKRRTIGEYICEARAAAFVGKVDERDRICDLGISVCNSQFMHMAPGSVKYPDTASRFTAIARVHSAISKLYATKGDDRMMELHMRQAGFAKEVLGELAAAQRTE